MAGVLRWLVLAAGLLWAAIMPAAARELTVRGGQHPGFSRLVLDLPLGTDWALGRGDKGYVLRLPPDVTFATSTVFQRMPHDRLADLRAAAPGELQLDLGCDCHVAVTGGAGGRLVIDLSDGPPDPSGPYEQPLTASGQTAGPMATDAGGQADQEAPTAAAPVASPAPANLGGATLSYRAAFNTEASLPLYWRDVPLTGRKDAAATGAAHAMAGWATPPAPPPAAAAAYADAEPAPESLPVHNTAAREQELLQQLSRAAAQGVAEIPGPIVPPDEHKAAAEPPPPDVPPPEAPVVPPDSSERVHIETAVDRDARRLELDGAATPDGLTCPDDSQLAVADWGSDAPVAAQIADARAALVGEFDRADVSKVEALARLYIHLGLGAEARQTLGAFDAPADTAALLTDMAYILDDQPGRARAHLRDYAACGGPVALWAFLAGEGPPADQDTAAITRAFAALPGHLRLLMGPRLADRLIAVGEGEAARTIRNAMGRAAAPGDRALAMVNADLRHAETQDGGEAASAAAYEALSGGSDEMAEEARIAAVQLKLAAGGTIEPKDIDMLAALAFQHRSDARGDLFTSLEILSRARLGSLPEAVDRYDRWVEERPLVERSLTARQLLSELAERADDGLFLKAYFGRHDLRAAAGPDADLSLALATRLADLGFANQVRAELTGREAEPEAARQLARAALQAYEPATALALLDAPPGGEDDRMRAEALDALDRGAEAAGLLEKAGAAPEAAATALRAGDWARATGASPAADQVIAALHLAEPPPGRDDLATDTLAGGRALLAEAQSARSALTGLLAEGDRADSAAASAP